MQDVTLWAHGAPESYIWQELLRGTQPRLHLPSNPEDVRVLEMRTRAYSGKFSEPKRYIAEMMENEGGRKVTSPDKFSTSHFYQVRPRKHRQLSLRA